MLPYKFSPRQAIESHEDTEPLIYHVTCDEYSTHDVTEYPALSYAYRIRSMRGANMINFHKRKRNGELLPFSPWQQYESEGFTSGEWSRYTLPAGLHYHDWYSNSHGYIWRRDWIISPEEVQAYAPSDGSEYVTRAAAQIYSQGWDLLTFVAELKDIPRLFASMASILELLTKRGRIPTNWPSMHSAWLSYRYGWTPLINDIKNIIKLVDHWSQEDRKRHRGVAFGDYSMSSTKYVPDIDGGDGSTRYLLVEDKIIVRPRGCVVADIVLPKLQINPIQTGWELIPFSFVIDWVFNVGRTIAALSMIANSTAYHAAWGYKIDMTRRMEYGVLDTAPYWISWSCSQNGLSSASLTRRIPCSIPKLPVLT